MVHARGRSLRQCSRPPTPPGWVTSARLCEVDASLPTPAVPPGAVPDPPPQDGVEPFPTAFPSPSDVQPTSPLTFPAHQPFADTSSSVATPGAIQVRPLLAQHRESVSSGVPCTPSESAASAGYQLPRAPDVTLPKAPDPTLPDATSPVAAEAAPPPPAAVGLPPLTVGARVRRNPQWWRWGNQDGGGPGTVTRVADDWATVAWDACPTQQRSYRNAPEGPSDLLPVQVSPARRSGPVPAEVEVTVAAVSAGSAAYIHVRLRAACGFAAGRVAAGRRSRFAVALAGGPAQAELSLSVRRSTGELLGTASATLSEQELCVAVTAPVGMRLPLVSRTVVGGEVLCRIRTSLAPAREHDGDSCAGLRRLFDRFCDADGTLDTASAEPLLAALGLHGPAPAAACDTLAMVCSGTGRVRFPDFVAWLQDTDELQAARWPDGDAAPSPPQPPDEDAAPQWQSGSRRRLAGAARLHAVLASPPPASPPPARPTFASESVWPAQRPAPLAVPPTLPRSIWASRDSLSGAE
eukprot:TRINITY_DN12845_c0_g1_i3.p1 TRINITY_DN12845_c0_g1~~TRINITY_DN12845_c0_g1_i3.p1  ORF type:complete len:535 (+),score=123.01 TRINITY_DN12845_c0_g1_i3:42-1607(+)